MTYAIPHRINARIFAGLLVLYATALFLMPALQAPATVWALVLLALAWLSIVHWGLIHEAIHKLLFPSPRANELGGRALAIAMGTSFHVLRFGHLMHHQLNRQFHPEQVEHPTAAAKSFYYANLLFGLYLLEVLMGLLLLVLPRRMFMAVARATYLRGYEEVAVAGERFFYQRGNIRATRVDALLGLLLYAAAFYLAGPQWPWIVALIAVRGLVISFMDNIYHFNTPVDNSKAAKELALPQAVSALILYGNYHETHHVNPDVPWCNLPQKHQEQQRRFDGDFVVHGLKQFNGPTTGFENPHQGECYA